MRFEFKTLVLFFFSQESAQENTLELFKQTKKNFNSNMSTLKLKGTTTQAQGCDVNSQDKSKFNESIALVKDADIAVLVLGNDRTVEHEGLDRVDTVLSGVQDEFAKQILALGKPTLLIMANGGMLAIDDLIEPLDGIVETFNPAQSTRQLASLLFGDTNRWGKLPVTMYPASFAKEKSMVDYDMSSGVGRTYKYYSGKPLYPFGYGLSLTTFNLSACNAASSTFPLVVECIIENTGSMDGDEVIQVYHSAGDDIRAKIQDKHPAPIRSLVAFERVAVYSGEKTVVEFSIEEESALMVNENGERVMYSGVHHFLFSTGVIETSLKIDLVV